jgi:acylpyruvate hydrolase
LPENKSNTRVIRNVWAIGRNYADHAKELGNSVPTNVAEPLIFLKAGSSIVANGCEFHLPSFSTEPHHEVEMALQFGDDFKFSGISIAIDMTLRDWQNRLKAEGKPWTLAKSFRDATLLGPIQTLGSGVDLQNLEFRLNINGELRQKGNTRDMIHSVESQRQYILERFPVVSGDLLLTGTPAGVGLVRPGDLLEADLVGILTASWRAAR